jgi:hypothetical protein
VDGLASPYTDLRLITVCWGDWTSPQGATWSCFDGTCREEDASQASLLAGGFVPFLYVFMKYHRVNGSLPGGAYPWLGHDVIRRAPQEMWHQAALDRFPLECPAPGARELLMLRSIMVSA